MWFGEFDITPLDIYEELEWCATPGKCVDCKQTYLIPVSWRRQHGKCGKCKGWVDILPRLERMKMQSDFYQTLPMKCRLGHD